MSRAYTASRIGDRPRPQRGRVRPGRARSQGIAVAPDGKHGYVATKGRDGNPAAAVYVFDTAFNRVTASIATVSPQGIACGSHAERVVSGAIGPDGSKQSWWMSGFTVQRQFIGQYLITFWPPFPAVPAIVGSQTNFGLINQTGGVAFPGVERGQTWVLTTDASGVRADRSFSFTATGIK